MSANPEPEYVGRPSDEVMRAYLDGEHGPPSPDAVQIVQEALDRAIRATRSNDGPDA